MEYRQNWSMRKKKRGRTNFRMFIFLLLLVACLGAAAYGMKAVTFVDKIEAEAFEELSPPPQKVEGQKNEVVDEQKQVEKEESSEEKNKKLVYLTFDDGPSKWTGDFLKVLKEHRIQATFFMQGSNLKKTSYQADVKQAIEDGHYVGAHSMTHDYNKLYKNRQYVSEMLETLELIYQITGERPYLVRSPYGSIPGLNDQMILNEVIEVGIKVWDWTIDSQDWRYQDDPTKIMDAIKSSTTKDVEIVLMHEKEQTLKLLPQIIAFFKEQGYEFGVYSEQHHFPNNFMSDDRL